MSSSSKGVGIVVPTFWGKYLKYWLISLSQNTLIHTLNPVGSTNTTWHDTTRHNITKHDITGLNMTWQDQHACVMLLKNWPTLQKLYQKGPGERQNLCCVFSLGMNNTI